MVRVTTDYNKFFDELDEKHSLYLYGAGERCKLIISLLHKANIHCMGIIDRDMQIDGYELERMPILHFSKLRRDCLKTKSSMEFGGVKILITNNNLLSAIRTLESCKVDVEALLPKEEKYGIENDWNSVISPIRKRIIGENISIISNNCIAGRLYSALGQKFCSPTINMIIRTEDFPKFCRNITHYMKVECKFRGYNRRSSHPSEPYYPIGRCDDVDIHFVHYSDFETAVSAWNRRRERIIYDKLYFIFCENGESIRRKRVEEFLELPYENKIVFKNMVSWNTQDVIFCNETFNILASNDLYERWFDLCGWVKHPDRLNEYI